MKNTQQKFWSRYIKTNKWRWLYLLIHWIIFVWIWSSIVYASISWPTTPDGETAWWSIGSMMSAITIDSWNVWIWKTPSVKLDVNGNITATNIAWTITTTTQPNITSIWTLSSLVVTWNSTFDTTTLFVDSTNNRVWIWTITPWVDLDVKDIDTSHIRAIITWQTNNPSIYMLADEANNKWWLYSTAPKLEFGANNSIHMTILSNGYVGIGTTSPDELLHINSGTADWAIKIINNGSKKSSLKLFESSGYGFEFQYDGSSDKLYLWSRLFTGNEGIRATWDKYGAMGIGTSTLGSGVKLHLYDWNINRLRLQSGHTNWNPWDLISYTDADGSFRIGIGSSYKMTILETWNVGIGTTTPTAKLEVDGNLKLWAGTVCDASNEGTLNYDSVSKSMRFCDWEHFQWLRQYYPRNCKDALDRGYSKGDGIYTVDADWVWWYSPVQVYCDMTRDWWWWTLVVIIWPNIVHYQTKTDYNIWALSNITNATQSLNLVSAVYSRFSDGLINALHTETYRFECGNSSPVTFFARLNSSFVSDATWAGTCSSTYPTWQWLWLNTHSAYHGFSNGWSCGVHTIFHHDSMAWCYRDSAWHNWRLWVK